MPPGLRERKNAEAKRVIYNAAMDLFRQKGFTETSVDEIVERAGFSRATFFNHFGNKQGVLRYYGQEVEEKVEDLVKSADPASSRLDLIRQIITAMLDEAEEHRDELKLVYSFSMRDPNYLFDPTPARRRVFDVLTEVIEEAAKNKELRQDLRSVDLALHIMSVYLGLVLAIIGGAGSAESLLNSAWQFILRGVENGNYQAR